MRRDRHVAACVLCCVRSPLLDPLRPIPPAQVRISSQHLQSGQFAGQQVRAVGKLMSYQGESVQLQLAGEGEPSDAPPLPPARDAACPPC